MANNILTPFKYKHASFFYVNFVVCFTLVMGIVFSGES